MNDLYIGFMSGTSCDGVDASLVRTDGIEQFDIIDNIHIEYPLAFSNKLQALMTQISPFLDIEAELTSFHAKAANILLKKNNYNSQDIKALGFHGQTICHQPQDKTTLQIGNPHLLAHATGIDVVHDFRRRDLSLGGQGAPLVPIFHKLIVKEYQTSIAIINIGGVANITYINPLSNELIAFDTGPGNALINDAMTTYYNASYDRNGNIAATGLPDQNIVDQALDNQYFQQPYPKSLDRNEFNSILPALQLHKPQDIIATLTYISAASIAKAVKILPSPPHQIFLCGGGSKNKQLTFNLKTILAKQNITYKLDNISIIQGYDPDYIESQAFAYLAARFFQRLPSAFPSTTNATCENICGCLVNKT